MGMCDASSLSCVFGQRSRPDFIVKSLCLMYLSIYALCGFGCQARSFQLFVDTDLFVKNNGSVVKYTELDTEHVPKVGSKVWFKVQLDDKQDPDRR